MPSGTGAKRRYTPAERAEHVRAFKTSGLSQTQYAKDNKITTQSLSSWMNGTIMAAKKKKKTGKRAGRAAEASGRFTEPSVELNAEFVQVRRGFVDEHRELKDLVKKQAALLARLM